MSYAEDEGHDIDFDESVLCPYLWECKDGSFINIHNMNTNHIKNCINMISRLYKDYLKKKRKHPWRIEYLDLLKEELKSRQ